MAETRIKVSTGNYKTMSCPKCGHKQAELNIECESCGIIFSKHLRFTPIKAFTSRFMSPKEVVEIRKTQERFSKIQHDNTSKMELLVHCHKEKLLDMAAFHIGKDDTIKNMSLGSLEAERHYRARYGFISFLTKPLVLIPFMLLLFLTAIALMLRTYIK